MRRTLLRLRSTYSLHRLYWRVRGDYQRARFFVAKSEFAFKTSLGEASLALVIFGQLALSVVGSILFAVLVTGGILWIRSLLGNVIDENRSAYDGIMTAIATVVGVFLTLHFTNISTVVGNLYAKLPERIRNLLIQEKVGNIYIRFLVFLTILSLVLLLVGAVFDIRPRFAIFVVVLLGCVAVLAFAKLAGRAFVFFDPTSFAGTLLGELARWSGQAATGGYLWNDASFQNHYRQQASGIVRDLRALVEVSHAENHLQREALTTLLARIATFLPIYLRAKQRIPSDSRWYALLPRHKQWYLAPSHEVGMATQTATSLQPEMKPDVYWLEEELLNLQIESLDRCMKDGRGAVGLQALNNLGTEFESLGAAWEIGFAKRLLSDITQSISVVLSQPGDVTSSEHTGKARKVEKLATVDMLALLPISLSLGLFKNVQNMHFEALSMAIERVNWQRSEEIYKLGLPAPILERLEFVQRRLEFEVKAEGRVVSPHWYLKQLIFQSVAYSLYEQLEILLEVGRSQYLPKVQQWINGGEPLLAVGLITQGLQFYEKALKHLPAMKEFATSLDTTRVLQQLPWPTWDWDKIKKELENNQRQLSVCLAQCIPGLSQIQRTEEMPDYLGQAVHTAGEECFQALMTNDLDSFTKIFPHYFQGVLNTHQMLREQTAEWQPQDSFATSSEPLIDLCGLSGYANVLSEFHQQPRLWDACKATWENYFESVGSTRVMPIWASIIAYNRSRFGVGHRALLRTSWRMQFNRLLGSLRRKGMPRELPGGIWSVAANDEQVVDHPSLLIRVMGGTSSSYSSHFDGMDVFVDLYLKQRPDAQSLDFGRGKELLKALERWRQLEARQNLQARGSVSDSENTPDRRAHASHADTN